MKTFRGIIARSLLGLSARETAPERRGFRCAIPAVRAQLEQIGIAFVSGYNIALEQDTAANLAAELNCIRPEWRGFAYEGAAMSLAVLDVLTPWRRNRVEQFLQTAGEAHAYMIHVGVGWAWARLPVNVARSKERFDPVLRWLALDGYGFHEAFFKWPRYLAGANYPRQLSGYDCRAFDQGFGRCLWFVDGGDVDAIAQTISTLSPQRHADLWSGIGLAATYAGGASGEELLRLREVAGEFQPQLAQGAAFAAKARQRAGNSTGYTDVATRILCEMSAPAAAQLCDTTLENLPANAGQPAYELWRCRIQKHFQPQPQLQEV